MKVDTAVIAKALAGIERINEEMPGLDPNGIGASTLRLVVDAIGGEIKAAHPRFNTGAFTVESLPISNERMRQAILKRVGQ